jgi:hypothetical protein
MHQHFNRLSKRVKGEKGYYFNRLWFFRAWEVNSENMFEQCKFHCLSLPNNLKTKENVLVNKLAVVILKIVLPCDMPVSISFTWMQATSGSCMWCMLHTTSWKDFQEFLIQSRQYDKILFEIMDNQLDHLLWNN